MAKKIFLIEDSQTDAEIVRSLLAEEGLDLEVATTGKEGLERLKELKPDLLLLDLMLPDISGFDVCEAIRKDPELKKSVVIMFSVRDNIEDITKAFNLGVDDYIIKPAVPEFLVKKIKLYLMVKKS